MDTLAVKARENSSRRRAVEAFIVEANSNLQFPLPPLAFGQTSPVRKVNKDGRSLCACQEARMLTLRGRSSLKSPNCLQVIRTSRRFCPQDPLRQVPGNARPGRL